MSTQQTKMVVSPHSSEPSNQENLLFKSLFQTNENSSPGELRLDDNHSIIYRKEDGYIDVTGMCKAGGKKFSHWNSSQKTKEFLTVLSSTAGIPAIDLLKQNEGGNGDRHTWVHPQVAINIAQWISPKFDVLVSKWVFQIMLTGKVDDGDGPRSSKELIEIARDSLREEARQLSKKVNRVISANNPCIYLYYVGNRIVKLGYSKDTMAIRNMTHQNDPEFSICILISLWPATQSVEVEIHKQLKDMRVNKGKTGKKETYNIPDDSTLEDFIGMIDTYVESFTKTIKLEEENRDLKQQNEIESLKKDYEISLCKKDNELSKKDSELALLKKDLVIRDLELKLCKLEKVEKKDQNSSKSLKPSSPLSEEVVLQSSSRVCTTCKETKQDTEFHKRSDECINRVCKACVAKQQKAYKEKKKSDGVDEIVKESFERIVSIVGESF